MKPKAVSPTKKQANPAGQSRQRPEQADKLPVVEKTTKFQARPISRTKSCFYGASELTPKSVGRRSSTDLSSSGSSSGLFKSSSSRVNANIPKQKKKPKPKPSAEGTSSELSKKCAPNSAEPSLKERPTEKVTLMEQGALRKRLASVCAGTEPGKENQGDPENVKPTADDK